MVKLVTLLKHFPGGGEVNDENFSQDNRCSGQFRTDKLQSISQNYCCLIHLFRFLQLSGAKITRNENRSGDFKY
jgi:hypothetical protein